jgi:hypothetical protein
MFLGVLALTAQAAISQYPVAPVPDYAIAVKENYPKPLPDGPIIVSYYRPLTVPYDKQVIDDAARKILQVGFLTNVKEARQPDQLAIPMLRPRALSRLRAESPAQRAYRESLDDALTTNWEIFEARVTEIRFFVDQPDEAKLAIRRATEAWGVVRSLLLQHPQPLTPSMSNHLSMIEAALATLNQQAAL